jgi:hypothetical protein
MYQGGFAAQEDAAKRKDEYLLGKPAELPAGEAEQSRVSTLHSRAALQLAGPQSQLAVSSHTRDSDHRPPDVTGVILWDQLGMHCSTRLCVSQTPTRSQQFQCRIAVAITLNEHQDVL